MFDGMWLWGGKQEEVAIKMHSIETLQDEDRAAVLHVATTTFLASDNTHVCKMHGIHWKDGDIW